MYFKIIVIIISIATVLFIRINQINTDFGCNVIELIEKYGYPIERHKDVQTIDGYLLELHRIPHGKNNSNSTNKPAVLLVHCFLCSSVEWIYMGPERGLGYILADLGFDVWLGSVRGNTWSRNHIRYDPDESNEFWNFCLHQIGIYDLPAIIDYVLLETKQPSLYYIGHSQGTLSFFIMASERPEYNKKIRFAATLGPAAYLSNTESPVLLFMKQFENVFELTPKIFGTNEFGPHRALLSFTVEALCNNNDLTRTLCSYIFFAVVGFNSDQLNKTLIPVVVSNTPAGSSFKVMSHYLQLTRSSIFCQYDYGIARNLLIYGKPQPPKYNLGNVTAPVGLYYASNDWIISTKV